MLLTLLYHRLGSGKLANSFEMLNSHLRHIAKFFPTFLPGDTLPSCLKTKLCLTFDDATVDFYTKVLPLLEKYKLKAVLAVPVNLIGSQDYCTWKMLEEIVQSKIIHIACHSFNHFDLTKKSTDLIVECLYSKAVLEQKLNLKISTFVYPFGKCNRDIHKYIKKHYKYIMRIGSALNFNWKNSNQLIYRIPSDNLNHYKEHFQRKKYFKYFIKFCYNTIRLK